MTDALAAYIQAHQGIVTSPPGSPLRFETEPGSSVAADLTRAGHRVRYCGSTTRVGGPSGFINADTYLIVSKPKAPAPMRHDGELAVERRRIDLLRGGKDARP